MKAVLVDVVGNILMAGAAEALRQCVVVAEEASAVTRAPDDSAGNPSWETASMMVAPGRGLHEKQHEASCVA